MYACDAVGSPTDVMRRIVPAWNSFAMFAVSSISHHQVPPGALVLDPFKNI